MKEYIDPFSYAQIITHAVSKGVLLNTAENGRVNTMSISWGTVGMQWGKPIFTVFVRGCRHTKPTLDATGVFTVSIPLEGDRKEIIRYCGTKSGRDTDKLADMQLHAEPADVNGVPGIRELPLTLECKVIYAQQQVPELMLDPELLTHYPAQTDNIEQDYHTAYYGEILSAYIIR